MPPRGEQAAAPGPPEHPDQSRPVPPGEDGCAASGFPPEQVDGGAVALRRVRAGDADAIAFAVRVSLDHLRPWMPWATEESASRAAQLARVAEADDLWEAGRDFIYSVVAAPENAVAGQVGLHRRVGDGGIEIGYWIGVNHTGRGLGTAAARALTPVALALPGVTRVEIHCDEANVASAAIPRKLGYRLDRVVTLTPEAPGERGRRMIWLKERPDGAE